MVSLFKLRIDEEVMISLFKLRIGEEYFYQFISRDKHFLEIKKCLSLKHSKFLSCE